MKRLKKAEYDVLKALQDDYDGELAAVRQYKEHIEKIDNPEIKQVLTHIMEEEEHHLDELTELLEKYFGQTTEVQNNIIEYWEDRKKQKETAE